MLQTWAFMCTVIVWHVIVICALQEQPAGDKPAEEKPATGDTQTDSGDKPSESKDTPPEAKKPKKQVKHVDLPVESVTFSLSKTDLNAVMEKEVTYTEIDFLALIVACLFRVR